MFTAILYFEFSFKTYFYFDYKYENQRKTTFLSVIEYIAYLF